MSTAKKSAETDRSLSDTDGTDRGVGPLETVTSSTPSMLRSPLGLASISGLLLWATFPPLGWWPLVWLAPAGLIVLIRQKSLTGKRPYLAIWLAGMIYNLVLFQFIRLPHPALYFGWIALAIYLGIYFVLFVALSRVAVHRLGMNLVVVVPVVWTGLELARGYLVSGFSLALLGHALAGIPLLIQSADLCGAYTVSFLTIFVTACLVRMWPCGSDQSGGGIVTWWPGLLAVLAIAAMMGYGAYRLGETPIDTNSDRSARVALIQGSIDTVFDLSPEEARNYVERSFAQYRDLTISARRRDPNLDLIVWPETKFPVPDIRYVDDFDPDVLPPDQRLRLNELREAFLPTVLDAIGQSPVDAKPPFSVLVGAQSLRFSAYGQEIFNAALLIDSNYRVVDRYDKMHRVPFGEYVLLGDIFPWIYRWVPFRPITPGNAAQAFQVGDLRIAPNICFESTVPHVIRAQIVSLRRSGQAPDALVNITDDGWFWGSSCLDHHLACTTMRAVEHRIPILVAANTGFSAALDGNGRILAKSPRRETDVLMVTLKPDGRRTLYGRIGDWPVLFCAAFCACMAILWTTKAIRRSTG